jgi:hypothetical protein
MWQMSCSCSHLTLVRNRITARTLQASYGEQRFLGRGAHGVCSMSTRESLSFNHLVWSQSNTYGLAQVKRCQVFFSPLRLVDGRVVYDADGRYGCNADKLHAYVRCSTSHRVHGRTYASARFRSEMKYIVRHFILPCSKGRLQSFSRGRNGKEGRTVSTHGLFVRWIT